MADCSSSHECHLKRDFSSCSNLPTYIAGIELVVREPAMSEIVRSGLIILMGMTVMAAGILVVFYG